MELTKETIVNNRYKENRDAIIYTLRHRKAFLKCVEVYCPKKYKDKVLNRAKSHDMDKVVEKCFYEEYVYDQFHTKCRHHQTNLEDNPSLIDCLEMVFDWESSRYTKPLKRNAYTTLTVSFPHLKDKILPILKECHLDSPINNDSQKVIESVKDYYPTDEEIKTEIDQFVANIDESCDTYPELLTAISKYKSERYHIFK